MRPFSYKAIQRGVRKLSLFLVVALVVCLGFKNILEPQNSAAKESRSANFVTMTANTWSDSFNDVSGMSDLMDVQIFDGKLTLANDALLGSATSILISPTLTVQSWGRLYFTASIPLSTALTIDVLDTAGVPLMHDVPNGGSLAGIDAEMYPMLKLRATLSSSVIGQTSSLDEWNLTWTPEYPYQIYLPISGKSFGGEPPPPPLGAAIGFTGANSENPPGERVHFPSLRKNDDGWTSSFAIQNTTDLPTMLLLEFFRENGTVAYAENDVLLLPYGTYIASLTNFPFLADGSYALAVTATEPIVGMVITTKHVAGAMAVAYNGTSQGSQQVFVPVVYKNVGWTSRLCVHNMTPEEAMNVKIAYLNVDGTVAHTLWIDIPGNGVYCDTGESLPPSESVA